MLMAGYHNQALSQLGQLNGLMPSLFPTYGLAGNNGLQNPAQIQSIEKLAGKNLSKISFLSD
jgi:hypothetical protein